MALNKSLLTNLLSLSLVGFAWLLPAPWQPLLLNAALFALSGGLTNWLAVYMLFERVPGFYGSGVIELHFESFKAGIRRMVMQQFFNPDAIERFWQQQGQLQGRVDTELRLLIEDIDLNQAFDSLGESTMASSLGGMLGMFGGKDALEPLREPFSRRMRHNLVQLVGSDSFQRRVSGALSAAIDSGAMHRSIEHLVDRRLQELTPDLVKQLVQGMMREHLGWLVVWGAVVGGLVGLLLTVLQVL